MSITRRQVLTAMAVAPFATTLRAAEKPVIRILMGLPPGGGTDAIARYLAEQLQRHLGRTFIIENKVGVGGRLAANALVEAAPDGTTYMIAPNATPTFQTLIFGDQINWDILTDFTPVAGLVSYPLGMAVNPDIGVKNVQEFVAWVKANPDKASYGAPGVGGQNAFLGEQFAKVAGIKLPLTPYKGTPPMITDLVGGHIPSAVSLMDQMIRYHEEGRVRVIGIFSDKRSPLLPGIPTFAEQGYAVKGGDGWNAMWAPRGTPDSEVEPIRTALKAILVEPEVVEFLGSRLFVTPDYLDGKQLLERQREELELWKPIIAESGFKAN